MGTNCRKERRGRPVKTCSLQRKKQMAAGEFKAKCLRLIDEVSETGQEIVITKRGKPKAKLIPLQERQEKTRSSGG